MSLDKVLKSFPTSVLKEAKTFQNKIREFEETEKGNFIAFVDDGSESYDVNIVLNPTADSVEQASCDCNDKSAFCIHKVAVLIFMKDGSKSKSNESTTLKKIRKKKLSPIEELMDGIDAAPLRSWLLSELIANKELAFKFKTHFNNEGLKLTIEQFNAYGTDTLKAILKTKKYIENSHIKPILDIWNKYLDGHFETIIHLIPDKDFFAYFLEIKNFHEEINNRLKTNSTRVHTNFNKISDRIYAYVTSLPESDQITFFQNLIEFLGSKNLSMLDASICLTKIGHSITKENFIKCFHKLLENGFSMSSTEEKYLTALVTVVVEKGVLAELKPKFKILSFYNEYNLQLLKGLIEIKAYDEVIDSCKKIITRNSEEKYDLAYLNILIEVYSILSDRKNLILTKKMIFEICPEYHNYKAVDEMLESNSDKSAFKKLALTKQIRPQTKDYIAVLSLKFGIWYDSEDYEKILDKLDTPAAYDLAKPFLEKLYLFDKYLLLEKFFNHIIVSWYFSDTEDDEKTLKTFIANHYTLKEILSFESKHLYMNFAVKEFIKQLKESYTN